MVWEPLQANNSQSMQHVHVPPQTTSFIGREKELADIVIRLQDPACRLLTPTGVGGIGKTRLAIQSASSCHGDFAHGIFFIALQSIQSVESLPPPIAEVLPFGLADSFSSTLDFRAIRQTVVQYGGLCIRSLLKGKI